MTPNPLYSKLASDADIQTTVAALAKNGMKAIVAKTGEEAKRLVLDLIPKRSEVFSLSSVTLETIGLAKEINESGNFDAVRPKLYTTQAGVDPMQKARMGSAPQWAVGSVHAVTHSGQVMIASNTGSQLASYVSGAANVVWVVGSQKIVTDLSAGFDRIYTYCLPLENERAQKVYGMQSNVGKILIVNQEIKPGRITVVIVKVALGF